MHTCYDYTGAHCRGKREGGTFAYMFMIDSGDEEGVAICMIDSGAED